MNYILLMFNFIYNNEYIKKWKKDKVIKIDNNSLKTLIDTKIEHGDSIKLGITLEKLFKEIILEKFKIIEF